MVKKTKKKKFAVTTTDQLIEALNPADPKATRFLISQALQIGVTAELIQDKESSIISRLILSMGAIDTTESMLIIQACTMHVLGMQTLSEPYLISQNQGMKMLNLSHSALDQLMRYRLLNDKQKKDISHERT